MPVSRFDMEGYEVTFYENGHQQHDGYGVHDVPDPEGMWVLHEDYEKLRSDFEKYVASARQLTDHITNVIDYDDMPEFCRILINKVELTHEDTYHLNNDLWA